MGVKVTNNAFGVLASGISPSDTVITLGAGEGARFPTLGTGDYFYATLIDVGNALEVIKVTNRAADTLTAVRGQDGFTARTFDSGDRIELRPTAVLFTELSQAANNQYDNTASGLTGDTTQEALDEIAAARVFKAASSTNNALVRFDGTTGKQLKNSPVTLDDQGNSVFNGVNAAITSPTSTSDIVLTNASTEQQFVTLNGTRLRVRLPDATTLAVGRKFRIRNVGYDEFAIALNDNWMVRALLPREEDTLTLLDNTTANGSWHSEALGRLTYKFGMPTFFANTIDAAGVNGIRAVIMPGGSTVVVSYADRQVSAGRGYAVAGSISGQSVSYGSSTAIWTGGTILLAPMLALNSSRVFTMVCRSGSSIIPVPLNISGTTISVGTNGAGTGDSSAAWVDMYRIDDEHALVFNPSGITSVRRIYRHNDSSAPTAGTTVSITIDSGGLGAVSAHIYSASQAIVYYARGGTITYYSNLVLTLTGTPTAIGTLITDTTRIGGSSSISYAALNDTGRFALNTNGNAVTFGDFDLSVGTTSYDANDRKSTQVFDVSWSPGDSTSDPTELILVDANKFITNWSSATTLSTRVLTFMEHDGVASIRRLLADLGFTQNFPRVQASNTHLAVDPGTGRIAYVYTLDTTGFYTVILEQI